jgi:excinuclease ABC subunit C
MAGIGAGVAVAALGPTAAMGIATTFGVASTGTAISALSGAAATNAALAWLGGGALAAGGGGMAAGSAFLALAGPIGWAIAGVAIISSGLMFWKTKSDKERFNAIDDLKRALNMEKLVRIEAFDNSHLFGTFYVGGMVVFDNFLPNKDLYRKFKISTEVKDDLSAMREVIYRRYFKVLMEDIEKPDLIIVDGGETQVSVAKEIIDSLRLSIRVIGLKKDDKHRTNVIVDSDLKEIVVDSKSNLFLFLTKIQDEVHRYAITYHRNIKSKGLFASVLDMAEGIGEKRKKELLKRYGSLRKIKEASFEELEEILGSNVAKNLQEYLKNIES